MQDLDPIQFPSMQLLDQRWGTVQEVAYAVGYNDAEHFTKVFRQAFGVVPSAYAEGFDS